jgi:O-acetyl-ADP-ribose deacetylase (regulator of RNase III)
MSSLFLDEIRWGNNDVIINDNDESNNIINDDFPIVFPIDHNMNKKIHLFCGDCMKLPADALVIGNYESLNYRGEDNGALFTLGGPSFEKDVEDIESCLTGNSVIVSGGNTVFNHVIFAIGPKYDINYKETCDSSLWGCYYSALNIATVYDNDPPIKTIAICSLYLKCKKYPRDLGAHVALRTIRKFISHAIGNKLERIILCCNNPDDYAIYQSLLPAYFPRSIEDAILQCDILPENVGNEWGEIISQHRSIKVTAGPRPSLDSTTMKPLSLPNSPNPTGGPIKTGNSNLNVTWKPPRKMSEVIADDDKHRIWRGIVIIIIIIIIMTIIVVIIITIVIIIIINIIIIIIINSI